MDLTVITVSALLSTAGAGVLLTQQVLFGEHEICSYEPIYAQDHHGEDLFLDMEVVKQPSCRHHMLYLPPIGTVTGYTIWSLPDRKKVFSSGPLTRLDVGQWDFTHAQGKYEVSMGHCHGGDAFKLAIR